MDESSHPKGFHDKHPAGGFIHFLSRVDVNDDNFPRVVMFCVVCLIGIIDLFVLGGFSALIDGHVAHGVIDIIAGLLLVANLLLFRRTGRYRRACRFALVVVGLLFFHLFYTGGVNTTGFMWLYTFPLFAFFLLGSREGGIISVVVATPRHLAE